jgi:hypothetical protein
MVTSLDPKQQSSLQKKEQKLKEMLSKPTNNFGLALLLKNFVLMDPDY